MTSTLRRALFAARALAALAVAVSAAAQAGATMLWSNPWSNYTTVSSHVWTSPAADVEAADDFDVQGAITRVVVDAFDCFYCAVPTVTGATVRFYADANGTPGAQLYETFLPAGSPALLYDPTGPATIECLLGTPSVAPDRHFVSVQLHFAGSATWDIWVGNMNAPALSPLRVRDRLANGPWTYASLGPWTTSPLWADLTFQLWGMPAGGGTPTSVACTTWSELPTSLPPGSSHSLLRAVKAFGPGDAWAAGTMLVGPVGNSEQQTLTLHWDGASWTQVPSPNPAPAPGLANLTLYALDGTSSQDLWAAGSYSRQTPGGWVGQQVFAMHFDGTAWSVPQGLPLPNTGIGGGISGSRILDVEAEAANDVWFVGDWLDLVSVSSGQSTRPGFLMHWDGSALAQTVLPIVSGVGHQYFESVAAAGPADVWVAGGAGTSGLPGSPTPVLFHFDGSQWTHRPCPTPVPGANVVLHDLQMLAGNAVYVYGTSRASASAPAVPFVAHWNGTAWSLLPAPPAVLTAIEVVAPNEIYGVANGVWEFDGATWTQTETFASQYGAGLQAVDAFGPCSVLAAGGQQRIGQVTPFAARLDANGYGYGTVRLPSVAAHAPGTLVAISQPLVGGVLTIVVDDPSQALGVPGALVMWVLAAAPAPGYPAGLVVPFGGANGGPGELFVDMGTIGLTSFASWAAGPAAIALNIPNAPVLVGADVYSQAALLDLATGLRIALTNGLDLHLGQ